MRTTAVKSIAVLVVVASGAAAVAASAGAFDNAGDHSAPRAVIAPAGAPPAFAAFQGQRPAGQTPTPQEQGQLAAARGLDGTWPAQARKVQIAGVAADAFVVPGPDKVCIGVDLGNAVGSTCGTAEEAAAGQLSADAITTSGDHVAVQFVPDGVESVSIGNKTVPVVANVAATSTVPGAKVGWMQDGKTHTGFQVEAK